MVKTNMQRKHFFVTNIVVSPKHTFSHQNLNTKLNIYHQNLCGVSNKKDDLELYIDGITEELHYVCISEHFLNKTVAPMFHLHNFDLCSWNARVNKTKGGTMILARKGRPTEEVPIQKKLYKMESFEISMIKDIETNLYIACVYRNPKKENFDGFMERLEKLLEYSFDKKCIICGDFNVDLTTDTKNRSELLNLLKCFNFRHLVYEVTFKRNDSSSCIDNFLTNLCDTDILDKNVDHNGLADGHAGLTCKIQTERKNKNSENLHIFKELRSFNEQNMQNYRYNLSTKSWTLMGINTFIKTFNDTL